MLWLHIVILVGLVSIIIPAMFSLLLCFKMKNLSRSLLVAMVSIVFSTTATFYIYSGSQLYIMIGSVVLISVIAGILSYYLFEKQLKHSMTDQEVKAG